MNHTPTKTSIVATSLVALLATFALSRLRAAAPPDNHAPAKSASLSAPVTEKRVALSLDGYRQWKRVNEEPIQLSALTTMLCRDLTPEERAERSAKGAKNPHLDDSAHAPEDRRRFATVYVNEVGADAMFKQAHPVFPVGSVIVKEKLTTPTSKTPELLTVMRKRERDYNPMSGDWEYLVFDGKATKVQAQGRLTNCEASCHAARKATDYVYRDEYLPWEARRDMK